MQILNIIAIAEDNRASTIVNDSKAEVSVVIKELAVFCR